MKKIRLVAQDHCQPITLSNRSGTTFNYSCTLTPVVGSYITQNDCMLRFYVESVDTGAGTFALGVPDNMNLDNLDLNSTILLSNPFDSDCAIEFESSEMLYLWGLTFQCRNHGEDDILNLQVMMPDGEGGLILIKPYERTWAGNIDKIGLIETPDKAPGEIPAGLVMRIQYFTFKTDSTVIHANYDYILTIKS
jgi:hypothetical protein